MIEEVRAALSNARTNFEANVQDTFGKSVSQEVYQPFEDELAALQQAFEEAQSQQQTIKNILGTLRAMI